MGRSEAPNGASQAPATRLEHLASVLRAVREVNQLIARERDPQRLLREACDRLLRARGYRAVWLALVDERGTPSWATASGEEERLGRLLAHIGTGRLPPLRPGRPEPGRPGELPGRGRGVSRLSAQGHAPG
jgi:hypothetical protein